MNNLRLIHEGVLRFLRLGNSATLKVVGFSPRRGSPTTRSSLGGTDGADHPPQSSFVTPGSKALISDDR